MLRQRRRTTSVAGVLGLCVALSGCVPQGLAFRVDDRLTFTSPEDRSTVDLPVVIDWEIRDFDIVDPDEEYLNARGIYTTTETRLVLEQVPRTTEDDRKERHRAIVVLLDADGYRIGESAFEIAFDVERSTSS